jgi:hypothetical protein
LPALADGKAWALTEDVALGDTDALGAGVGRAADVDGADDGAEPCATALGDGSVACGCAGSTLQLAKMVASTRTNKIESGRFRMDDMEFLLNTINRMVRITKGTGNSEQNVKIVQ